MVLSAEDKHPRGNVWKITAKKTDFYLDFEGIHGGVFHLSAHGPNDRFDGHRFHVKRDRKAAQKAKDHGYFVGHQLGKGHKFDGVQLAEHAFLIARLRWNWDLQRHRFRDAALTRTLVPELSTGRDGRMLNTPPQPNSAWDIDLVVSYGDPFWPDAKSSASDDSRLGPLVNSSGMWLTATSYHRPLATYPTPEDLRLPVPRRDETPQSILIAGPGPGGAKDIYWFVEGITRRDLLTASDSA